MQRALPLAALVAGLLNPLAPAAEPPGRDLFSDGLAGWELIAPAAAELATACTVRADGVVACAGKPTGFLATRTAHRDYRLHVEWRWTGQPGNGGVLVHISPGPMDRAWPLSLQVQTKHRSVGDLLPMAAAAFAEPLTSAAGAAPRIRARTGPDSEKPAGEWNACDIVCAGDSLTVTVNGVLQNRVTGCSPREGRIGFQFEGAPFELRNVRLAPLE